VKVDMGKELCNLIGRQVCVTDLWDAPFPWFSGTLKRYGHGDWRIANQNTGLVFMESDVCGIRMTRNQVVVLVRSRLWAQQYLMADTPTGYIEGMSFCQWRALQPEWREVMEEDRRLHPERYL